MTTNKDTDRAELIARKFHEVYERLAPSFGYETRQETRRFDPTTPNGRLMIAVCGELAAMLAADGEAGGEAVHQWRKKGDEVWHDSTEPDVYRRHDDYYEKRTLYTRPQQAAPEAALESLGWQRISCPICGADGARAAPQQAAQVAQPLTEERRKAILDNVDWFNFPEDLITATEQAHGIDEIAKPEQQEQAGEPEVVTKRQYDTAMRQWETWKSYALELQAKLVKYEGGSPMILNAATTEAERVPLTTLQMRQLFEIKNSKYAGRRICWESFLDGLEAAEEVHGINAPKEPGA